MTFAGITIEEILPLEYEPGAHNSRASSAENVSRTLEQRNAEQRVDWRAKYDHAGGQELHQLEKLAAIRSAGL